MVDQPSVSVVITTFNRPLLLEKAIHSAIKQSLKPLEIIVVDDGGKKGLRHGEVEAVLYRASKIDQSIELKLHVNAFTNGVSNSRNVGAKLAKGEFITFLDDDDYFHLNKLKVQTSLMLERGWDISTCVAARVASNGNQLAYDDSIVTHEFKPEHLSSLKYPVATGIMISSDVYRSGVNFNPGLNFREDTVFLYDAYIAGFSMGVIQNGYALLNCLRAGQPGLTSRKRRYSELRNELNALIDRECLMVKDDKLCQKLIANRMWRHVHSIKKHGHKVRTRDAIDAIKENLYAKDVRTVLKILGKWISS